MTVDNATQILNKIPKDKWEKVMGEELGVGLGLGIPEPVLEEIQWRYSTDTGKNHACAEYYVNCHPQAEWGHLSICLYQNDEFAPAKEAKSFMSTGKLLLL